MARARGVLLRTVVEAAKRHGGSSMVPLSRLKDTMQGVAPEFDEVALGFKTFTHFLSAFPEVVVVDRATNSARPNAGIVPEGASIIDVEPGERGRSGPERRRRARKSPTPTSKQADAALAASAPKASEGEKPGEQPPAPEDPKPPARASREPKPQKEGEPELPLLESRSRPSDASDRHA
jgi:hypothetical protein